ncbi:hypothetical protein [Vannielia sp.]|uniref:hypothetical protein n=1 Tax=Vannielia sp. TaxID=2813045 RepID=UPI002631ABCD|nr:hypothetical protein [Vannielia sp.]MDF1872746.1 hypothetical protein [Vannielia sp.]
MIRLALTLLLLTAPLMVAAETSLEWARKQPQPTRAALVSILKNSEMQSFFKACPANVYNGANRTTGKPRSCGRKPNSCFTSCLKGESRACFGLANALQTTHEITPNGNFTYPLYMKACALGVANACVNAAATVKNGSFLPGTRPAVAGSPSCQLATYSNACTEGAAWGCTMMGNIYETGQKGTEKNTAKSEAAYRRACDLSPKSGACSSAYR